MRGGYSHVDTVSPNLVHGAVEQVQDEAMKTSLEEAPSMAAERAIAHTG